MHNILNDICGQIERNLEEAADKRDWTAEDINLVYRLVKTKYYIKTMEAMDEYSDDGYSKSRGYYRDTSRDDEGYSYRRGRYSRDTEKDNVVKELGNMMSRANSDVERQTIAKLMDRFS